MITFASEKGQRSAMEDAVKTIVRQSGTLTVVIDGHGGAGCVDYIDQNLELLWQQAIEKHKGRGAKNWNKVLATLFSLINEGTKHLLSGAVMSAVFVSKRKRRAHVAILGDCPVVIGGVSPFKYHNIRTNPDEVREVERRGAWVVGGYFFGRDTTRGLQPTRCFGDCDFEGIVGRVPFIKTVHLNPKGFVMVASDGVYESLTEEELLTFITETPECTADMIVTRALSMGSTDNVSCVFTDLSFPQSGFVETASV